MSIDSADTTDIYLLDEENDEITVAGFKLENMIYIFCGLGVILFIIYLLWNSQCWMSKNTSDDDVKEMVTPSSIFAYELEPGIVVMQSKDGEFFRILHEYDPATRGTKHYGAIGQSGCMNSSPVHYIPHYTRPVLQTQPTAPDLMDIGPMSPVNPPPYTMSNNRN